MNDEQYRAHCLQLLDSFAGFIEQQASNASEDDPLRELARGFAQLANGENPYGSGPKLVSQLFSSCPQLAPVLPRELLWYFGGDCLHYMPDDELAVFQQLDEMRTEAAAAGEELDYQQARAKLLKLQ
jgi:hypothetical protein